MLLNGIILLEIYGTLIMWEKEENADAYKTMLKKAGMKEITMFEDLVR